MNTVQSNQRVCCHWFLTVASRILKRRVRILNFHFDFQWCAYNYVHIEISCFVNGLKLVVFRFWRACFWKNRENSDRLNPCCQLVFLCSSLHCLHLSKLFFNCVRKPRSQFECLDHWVCTVLDYCTIMLGSKNKHVFQLPHFS